MSSEKPHSVAPSASSRDPLRVGEWRILPDLNRAEKDGRSVRLEPLVMETLVFLAGRAGQVVGRETLLESLWGDTQVVEAALTRVISELRTLFGDDARNPRYIETIRKGGYRLIAEVVREDGSRSPAVPGGARVTRGETDGAGPAPARAVSRSYRLLTGVLALVSAGAVVAFLWPRLRAPDEVRLPPQLAGVPFTTFPGPEIAPAISADGTRVAFAWNGGPGVDNYDIYVKQRNTETPLRLTDDPAPESFPTWSPDGTSIAFARGEGGPAAIYQVPAIGGDENKIAALASWPLGLDWSPDGEWIACSVMEARGAPDRVLLVSTRGEGSRFLTSPPEETVGDRYPVFSPDGGLIAFIRGDRLAFQDIFLVPAAGGEVRRLTRGHQRVNGLDWTPDGREIVFSSAPGGNSRCWRVSVADLVLTPLDVGGSQISLLSLASKGHGLVYAAGRSQMDIWQTRVATPPDSLPESFPLIASTRWDGAPRFSPDGSRIAFISDRSGCREIWICDRDGTHPMQLTSFDNPKIRRPIWSPDGEWIVFTALAGENPIIHVIDSRGGAPRPLTSGEHRDVASCWSRDGERIYFDSDRTGEWQVWAMSPEGTNERQVTQQGGLTARESPDGTLLYYVKLWSSGIWRMPVAGGPEELVASYTSIGDCANWVVGEEGAYFATYTRDGPAIAYYDFRLRDTQVIAPVPGIALGSLAISPDGRSVLYGRRDADAVDLMWVEEFR
jgi:Tol biopolymer transport system component/DNA-binding winged helix-turn-helix (wHTH) protein